MNMQMFWGCFLGTGLGFGLGFSLCYAIDQYKEYKREKRLEANRNIKK